MENNDKMSGAGTPKNPLAHLTRTGRAQGQLNKATATCKAAIAMFVEGNVERLQEWLDMVAHGYKVAVTNKDGEEMQKLVEPNPMKAYEMFMGVVEYHIPKLKSVEVKSERQASDKDLELTATTIETARQDYLNTIQ